MPRFLRVYLFRASRKKSSWFWFGVDTAELPFETCKITGTGSITLSVEAPEWQRARKTSVNEQPRTRMESLQAMAIAHENHITLNDSVRNM
jgi:hypothetical protein